jgi:hypothetical protein
MRLCRFRGLIKKPGVVEGVIKVFFCKTCKPFSTCGLKGVYDVRKNS